MRDTFVIGAHHPDGGYTQKTVFPDGTPKGLKAVLIEHSLWPQTVSRFLAQCIIKLASGKGMKPNPQCLARGNCCARALLAAQLDFQQQKSQIEDAILAAGHDVIFYPAFHCELNFIEYYRSVANLYARNNCQYDFEALKSVVPEALASVSDRSIWRYWAKSHEIMQAYRSNIVYASSEYANLVNRRYMSHRRVNNVPLA